MTIRQADKDDVVNGIKIPSGTPVFIAPGLTNFDQRAWGEDADQFNPDRWDSLPETISNYSFLTFLQGISFKNTIKIRHAKLYRSQIRRNRNEVSAGSSHRKLFFRRSVSRKAN